MGKMTAKGFQFATKPGRYIDGDGLMLIVKPTGARSWLLRVQLHGKRRDFGLGSASVVSLADARIKAAKYRAEFKSGVDPVAKRKAEIEAQRTIPTFGEAAEMAHEGLVAGWRNVKHRADWLSSLRSYAFPHFGNERVDLVTAPMVKAALKAIWIEKPETARRVRQRIRKTLDWAATEGFRNKLDLSGLSDGLPDQPKTRNHFEAMPWEHLPAFMARLRRADETVGRMALQFTVLTAARSGETRGATWKELDLEARLWRIPAARMKAGKPHTVPLSDAVVAILDRAALLGQKPDSFVFPGRSGARISDMTILKALRDAGHSCTVHGFRSSFKDWASESVDPSYPDMLSEVALAHMDENKVRAAYRRSEFLERRTAMMQHWADYCCGVEREAGQRPDVGTVAKLAKA